MSLSFVASLISAIPENYLGVELCTVIDQWLADNPEAQLECREVLKSWLVKLREMKASDLDFGAPGCGGQVWIRQFGLKRPISSLGHFSNQEAAAIILSWLSPTQKQRLFNRKSSDYSISFSKHSEEIDSRFRGSTYFDMGFLATNFRVINDALFTMEDLGIPLPIAQKMNMKHEKTGLILITGITGSGKSTTLDAIIDLNNRDNNGQIVIIGNPIEYVHKSKSCLVRHREVGSDVLSFESGAIDSLREDPDIIVVGEMRDAPTIATVLEITDSGHKSLTTLHTCSAVDSIHRIIAEFPPDEQDRVRNRLADVLSVTMSQKLVPTIDGKLIMAKEILANEPSVQAAIRNKNIGEIYQMMVEGRRLGMCTLEQDLRELQKKGIITQQTAVNYANNKKRMVQLIAMP
ncbi:ATPase, T2SS/T4P/T4SS family [Candidatus Cloacimonadota bacterium]|nr:Flp pilus assembly complex ATPase component TadA [Candidatus Cloacimonadota bacterium]